MCDPLGNFRLTGDYCSMPLAEYRVPLKRPPLRFEAYDVLLAQACAAVGVVNSLDDLPEGVDRDIERLRVEEALRQEGLAIP